MTVGELKAFLAKYPDDTPVITTSANFELRHAMVDAQVGAGVYAKESSRFRDAFDGGPYAVDVWKYALGQREPSPKTVVVIGG